MQGIRAPRVPRSRIVPFLRRASLLGGLCASTLIGGAALASADQPDTGPPAGKASAAVEQRGSTPAPDTRTTTSNGKASESPGKSATTEPSPAAPPRPVEAPQPGPATPAESVPTKPAQAEPAKPAPAEPAEPTRAKPARPASAEPASASVSESPGRKPAKIQRPAASASASASEAAPSNSKKKPEHAKAAKRGSKGAKNPPNKIARPDAHPSPQSSVSASTDLPEHTGANTRSQDTEAKPRAPDTRPRQAPLLPQERPGEAPTPPAQPVPTFSSASGGSINGLRYVHYTLPTTPDSGALTAGSLVAQRNIDPDIDTRSTEPVASPD